MEKTASTYSILDVSHRLHKITELTENFDGVDTPIGFNDVQLYPHQKTAVKALLDLEDKKVLLMENVKYTEVTIHNIVVESSALVLSEKFGAGKTIIILALILIKPIPKAFPAYVNSIIINFASRYNTDNGVNKFQHEIVKRIGGQCLIRPNLIVVGSSVLVQWANAIANSTNLRCF